MRAALLAAAWVGCSSPSTTASPASEPLDTFVPKQLQAARVPGLSAAIVKNGRVVFTGAWGFADVENKVPVRTDTVFLCASISKAVTATVVMKLVEQKKLALDADVNTYLPFSVRNPRHPDAAITLRQLLAHTSSIRESYIRLFTLIAPGDAKETLEEFARGFLLPGGKYWDASNFADYAPGQQYSYSQVGVALIGLVVERVTGRSFAEEAKSSVLAPVGMKSSSYRLEDLDRSRVAFPYVYQSARDVKQDHWGVPYYPAATLHSTAIDLSAFVVAMAKKGASGVVSDATWNEMTRVASPSASADQALLWQWRDVAGRRVVGHSGGAPGVSTTMYFDPKDGVGVITLSNGDVHVRVAVDREEFLSAFRAIEERLWREADRL